MRSFRVGLLPKLCLPADFEGRCVVVIDVLRASTTIVTALAAGAHEIRACGEVEQARRLAEELRGSVDRPVLLAGERGGLPIAGFDLGNSPAEYTPERVAGATIVLTTSNGTQALLSCREAARVLIGSFLNLAAVVRVLQADAEHITLLCAGTHGEVSRDDVLLAGAIAHRLLRDEDARANVVLNDEAELALSAWREVQSAAQAPAQLAAQLVRSAGGRNLQRIGAGDDLFRAADVNRHDIVPEYQPATSCIR